MEIRWEERGQSSRNGRSGRWVVKVEWSKEREREDRRMAKIES